MIRKKRSISLDNLNLSNPQRAAVSRVLTAQKNKYKKLLHETHERLHIIADMTTSLEFWYNVNGSYEFVSPASEHILGFTPADFMNGVAHLENLVHDDSLEQFRADRSRALNGEADDGVEYKLHTREGDTRWVQASWKPVQTRKGKQIGIRISIRDITEFKRCQHFSSAYESLMRGIANELSEVGIISVTADLHIKTWNTGAEAMLGRDRESMLDQPIALLLDDDHASSTTAVLEGLECGERREIILPLKRGDGGTVSLRVTLMPLCDRDGHLHQVTCLLRPTD
ncbi:PAS domain S-box protein [bacterium]|nr:PAS domain S-box protein [bacterium]